MSENDQNISSISKVRTIEEIAEFWDTHSLADYWDQTHEVEFEVRAQCDVRDDLVVTSDVFRDVSVLDVRMTRRESDGSSGVLAELRTSVQGAQGLVIA